VVLDAARNPLGLLAAHARFALRAPGRYARTFALALRTAPPGLRGLLWQIFYFLEAGVLAERLRTLRARRLHNHFGDSSCTVAMLAAELAETAFSISMHGPAEFYAAEKWRLDEKFARADFVACISHFCRSQCMLFARPNDWGKFRIVHCGVDPALYEDPQRREGVVGARILFVGRLSAAKGVRVLFAAMAQLRRSHPQAHLTLIGDGPERAELERAAAEAGLTGSVAFLGYRTQAEVAAELAQADVFALPSFAEGLPVVLMEALAARTTVVATAIAGVSELVRPGETGLLVPPGDPESLAESLARLLDDPTLRAKLAAAGREIVEREFVAAREAAWLLRIMNGEAPVGALRPDHAT
jgi:glycosyltransferase involved in cell wall biosynthesis